MSATTYSVGHSVARRLHVLYDRGLAPPIGGDASIRRLSDGQGTEDDLTGWARYCEAVGETMLAELLRSQLPSGPHLAAQVRMQRASAALDEAMARCDGKSVLDAEATGLLVCAVAEHSRAALFAADLEGRR